MIAKLIIALNLLLMGCAFHNDDVVKGDLYCDGSFCDKLEEEIKDLEIYLFRHSCTPENLEISLKKPNDSSLLPSDGQSFKIEIKGSKIYIYGETKNSISNGVYHILNDLGFKWYMPGKNWEYIPDCFNINGIKEGVITPDFRDRSYFGTGGWGGLIWIDTDRKVKKEYAVWGRRNRISTTFKDKGHTGINFWNENKHKLLSHPEYFCNSKPHQHSKLDFSNVELVKIYKEYAFSQANGMDKYKNIGLDPNDGSGGEDDCLSGPGFTFDSFSDKYFWIANEVAKEMTEENTKISLYAYSNHANIPSFKLKKNVRPIIIPYAFQNITRPIQFIELWKNHLDGEEMGIYDYWNITQWSLSKPQFNVNSIKDKLTLWKESNVNSIYLESTFSKGPMGHSLWLLSQYSWDVSQDFDALYDEFLLNCFGEGRDELKEMYNRWSVKYQQELEASLSYSNLKRALKLTNINKEKARINELIKYTVYLDKLDTYNNDMSTQHYNDLVDYMISIHDLGLIQTEALLQYYIKKKPASLEEAKSRSNKYESKNATISDYNIDYEISNYEIILENTTNKGATPALVKYINGTNTYSFYVNKNDILEFKLGATKDVSFKVLDNNSNVVFEHIVLGTDREHLETIKVPLEEGDYKVIYGAYYRFSRIEFPQKYTFLSSSKNYENYGYPKHYIYIPEGLEKVVYTDRYGPGTNGKGYWLDPRNNIIEPNKLKNGVYYINIPKSESGKVWSIVMGHPSFKLLNITEQLSLNNFDFKSIKK